MHWIPRMFMYEQIMKRLKSYDVSLVLGMHKGRIICGAVDGSSPLDSGPVGLSRSVCQQLQRAWASSILGNVVLGGIREPLSGTLGGEGTPFPEVPRTRGAESRRGVGPGAEPAVGARGPSARGRGRVSALPGPGHVLVRTPPPPS